LPPFLGLGGLLGASCSPPRSPPFLLRKYPSRFTALEREGKALAGRVLWNGKPYLPAGFPRSMDDPVSRLPFPRRGSEGSRKGRRPAREGSKTDSWKGGGSLAIRSPDVRFRRYVIKIRKKVPPIGEHFFVCPYGEALISIFPHENPSRSVPGKAPHSSPRPQESGREVGIPVPENPACCGLTFPTQVDPPKPLLDPPGNPPTPPGKRMPFPVSSPGHVRRPSRCENIGNSVKKNTENTECGAKLDLLCPRPRRTVE
jgi:hypothetical protein